MSYDVVLQNKYYLREFIERVSLEDSLDEIAYRGTISFMDIPDLPINVGQDIRITGIPLGGTTSMDLLHQGVIWDCDTKDTGLLRLNVTVYDRTIYLAKSEDERLVSEGQTASQRLKLYAKDWDIPIGHIPDTRIPLAKDLKRSKSIYAMITEDLKETVEKGGDMYRPRMTASGLELVRLGSNTTIWELATFKEIGKKRTLEGVATQVMILGQASDDQRSPILAIEKKDTDKYGTLQKVLQNDKITSVAQARLAAQKELFGVEETIILSGIDHNMIRAGDKARLNGVELFVTRINHELGEPGHMDMDLASEAQVRRKYYV